MRNFFGRMDRRDDMSDLEWAADKCANKIVGWLRGHLKDMEDQCSGEDDEPFGYNLGGEMLFLPEHQGGGFTGEFADDHYVAPLWLDGDVGQPCVWTAVEKAFIAGVKWQQKQREND